MAGGDGNWGLSRERELSREGSCPEGAQQALPRPAGSPSLCPHLEGAEGEATSF